MNRFRLFEIFTDLVERNLMGPWIAFAKRELETNADGRRWDVWKQLSLVFGEVAVANSRAEAVPEARQAPLPWDAESLAAMAAAAKRAAAIDAERTRPAH